MLVARWLAAALFVVAVPLFLLLSNVRVAAMEPRVHEYGFSRFGAEQRTGIDRAQLDRAARELVFYFRNDESLLGTRVLVDGEEQPLFSTRESLHMRDVKGLFQLVFTVHEIAFVYVVAYVAGVYLWARERPLHRLARLCMAAGAATAALLAIGAIAVVLGFDALFEQFHVLSFANDLWQLDPSRDRLVQMYPRDFWFEVSLGVGVATILEGMLLALAGYWLRQRYSLPRGRRTLTTSPPPPTPASTFAADA